jgi:hypothetical protein
MNLIKHLGFDTLTICAKDIEEPLYKDYLIPKIRKLEKRIKEPILSITTEPKDIPDIDSYDPEKRNVVIFDDQVITPNQENVKQIFMRGRKRGITAIFISQSYFDINKFVRKNCDYMILKSLSSVKDMKRILAEVNSNDIEPDTLVNLHKSAIAENPMNFLMIDLKVQDPNRKYRINFDKFLTIS